MIKESPPSYKPPYGLANPHWQNILASSALRRMLLRRRYRAFVNSGRCLHLSCGNGVTLAGHLNEQTKPSDKGLVILFHGWEGSSESGYVISAAAKLHEAGFDVFRLNFRDHGATHHLNRGLFHSALLEEVIGAVKALQKRLPRRHYFLAGFSLGGNFALRVALAQASLPARIDHVFAVCPVLDPWKTMVAMESTIRLYERYFVRKWKRSLRRKLQSFPRYNYGRDMTQLATVRAMNNYFVPRYTPFPSTDHYFAAYTLTGQKLANLRVPATILASSDDPIIPVEDLHAATHFPQLTIEISDCGSHCAFLDSYRMTSWADRRMRETFLKVATASTESAPGAAHESTRCPRETA